jgi:hypothetical protein
MTAGDAPIDGGGRLGPAAPLSWQLLEPEDRWDWFMALWSDALALRARYDLLLQAGWWADARQVEMLAALAEWVRRYDEGEWDDPPGKLQLLFELERIDAVLRVGEGPLRPERDLPRFQRHVAELIGQAG